jgi:uncharacterized spore protein YtfJ
MQRALDAVQQTMERARDALTVRRVFGEPLERDGVTVIPAALVRGASGGGGGGDNMDNGGGGSGFMLSARPVGAYVIRDGEVRWQPAIDPTRLAGYGMVLAGFLVLRSVVKRRRKAR